MPSDSASRARILRLSRLGAAGPAWAAFRAEGWDERGDAAARLLRARLRKDEAVRAAGAERSALLLAAADDYAAAAAERRSTYALINAASLAQLAGDRATGERCARAVLGMLDSGQHEPDLDYWLVATRAEALLVLGQIAAADRALGDAIAAHPRAWEDHAITLRQFALLLESSAGDARWLDPHRPARVLHFSGIMTLAPDDAAAGERIAAAVADLAPGSGVGALAAGADILIGEALLAAGADCHVVLPCAPEVFRAGSVTAVDPAWGPRFDRLLGQAASLEIVADAEEVSSAAVALSDAVAAGIAIERSRALGTTPIALRVAAQGDSRDSDPAAQLWEAAGFGCETLRLARSAAGAPLAAEAVCGVAAVLALRDPDRGVTRHGDLSAALSAAFKSALVSGAAVGLDFRLAADPLGAEDCAAALAAAHAAARGTIVASRRAAAAARLHRPTLEADLVGEVGTAYGREELWRLRAADQ